MSHSFKTTLAVISLLIVIPPSFAIMGLSLSWDTSISLLEYITSISLFLLILVEFILFGAFLTTRKDLFLWLTIAPALFLVLLLIYLSR